VVSILVVILLVLGSSASSLELPPQNCKEISDQHSYHMILSGPKIWEVLKFNFSEDTEVNRHISCQCSMNDSTICFIAELFQGCSAPYLWTIWSPTIAQPDRYYQYNIGPFSRTHFHQNNIKDWKSWTNLDFVTCFAKEIPQYYIFISYMNNSSYDIWLNWTGDATVSVTQGTDVFAYDRHDFTGTLNLGRQRGTFIVNGQKEISIEHTLFALFDVSHFSNGREVIRYKSPNGNEEWKSFVDRRGEHIAGNTSSEDFDENLLWGSNGNWLFSVNMLNSGLKRETPNFYLFGADIQLP
jgi:hypothetical protein